MQCHTNRWLMFKMQMISIVMQCRSEEQEQPSHAGWTTTVVISPCECHYVKKWTEMQRHCVNDVVTVATVRECINLLKSDAVLHIQGTKGQDPRRFNHLFVSQHWQLCHHDTVKSEHTNSASCYCCWQETWKNKQRKLNQMSWPWKSKFLFWVLPDSELKRPRPSLKCPYFSSGMFQFGTFSCQVGQLWCHGS